MNSFVALDVETANESRGSICSIGLVKFENGKIIDHFYSLINPEEDFSFFNTFIHGIHSEDVEFAPTFPNIRPKLIDFINDLPVVAHFAQFDMNALKDVYLKYQLPFDKIDYFCSYYVSKFAYPGQISYKLDSLAEHFNFSLNHHDALSDAEVCGQLICKLMDMNHKTDLADFLSSIHYKKFGTLGERGAGAGEEQGCQDQIDVYFSTFAKSMAGFGAFVAGDKQIVRYLKFNLRSQIFAKSLTMPMVIGGLKRLELLRSRPEIKAKLWENVRKLQNGLRERGFNLGETNTCVTPVFIEGSPVEATLLVKDLRENYGIFTSVVVYPVIPKGNILLRLIPTASHTDAEINETLDAFAALKEKLDSGFYKEQEKQMGLNFMPL